MPTPPASVSIAGFKAYYPRDFVFGPGPDTVMDADLTRALNESSANFNQGLFDTQETPIAYYTLMAHVLALNIQAAGGLTPKQNRGKGTLSKGSAIIAGKSVGGISVNYDTQDESYKDPVLSWLNRSEYGRKYIQMIMPRLVGHTITVAGDMAPDVAVPVTLPLEPPLV